MVMTGSRERCTRALFFLCRRAISSKPRAPAARSFSCSDEDKSHSRTLESYRPQGNRVKDLSPSLKPLSAHEENSHRRTRALKTLDHAAHSHGWNSSAQPLIAQKNTCSTVHYWPPPSSSSSFSFSDDEDNHNQNRVSRPRAEKTISVFWDLDNKPPHSVPPFDAAIRLREVACSFGRLVDMVAYANRHAFSYLPSWVKDERRHRKELDRLEVSGLVVPAEPYVCGYCGRKCKTNMALKKHFKQLHERERNKRLNRLDSLKGKKKVKYKQSLIEKETRYREASKDIIAPKVGYGLMQELKRAGVWVKMVSDRPQAADEALMQHISQSIHMGIKCVCLVSDDSDFIHILHEARAQDVHIVVVGDKQRLKTFADVQFSWADLASGRAFDKATELATIWYGRDKLGEGDSRVVCRKTDAEEAMHVHDFQDWDVSDYSDTEISDAESKHESSSGVLLSEDDDDDGAHDFQDWDISDYSDTEREEISDAESKHESSSGV